MPSPPHTLLRRTALPCAIGMLLWSPDARAQDVIEGGAGGTTREAEGEYDHAAAPRARAVRQSGSISIDGVLDEAIWSEAPPVPEFVQTLPFEGAPVSERTVVRLAYDDDAIYVGATLDDGSPVTTRLARRDAALGDSDLFLVLFDSYHDHETAYRFWTNPSGVKGDAIVTANSAGSGDASWDPVWDLATEVTESGWTVEMRVPFSQLRFRPDREQVWGIQLERNINRNQENATFPFTPLLERAGVSRYAHLDGLVDVEPGRRLELLPYVAARGEFVQLDAPAGVDFANPYRSGADRFANMGLDLKYRITSNVTLDATANPDFGQVELDPSVINLTAFETRYQERRPFFVEGADIFVFGEGGPRGSSGTGPELVYSRRIGRPPRGVPPSEAVFSDTPTATTIAAAAKVTGRVGDGWSVGILEAVTAREVAAYTDADRVGRDVTVEPAANYFVGRLRRQVRGGQTRFGMIASAVNRDVSAGATTSRLHASAYAAGIDFAHETEDRVWLFSGLFSGSYVSGGIDAITRTQRASTRYYQRPDAGHVQLDPAATSLGGFYAMAYAGKEAGNVRMRHGFAYVSPGYEVNDLGFHFYADRILMDLHYQYVQPEPGRFLRSWTAILGGPNGIWNSAGDRMFANINNIGRIELLNYWSLSARLAYAVASDDDRLTRGGPMARRPSELSGSFSVSSDGRRAVVGSANYGWGSDEGGGWTRSVQLDLAARFNETLQIDIGPSYSWGHTAAQYVTRIDDARATDTFGTRYVFAGIDRHTLSLETRVDLTFSPTLSLQLYVEPFVSTGDYGALKEFRAPGTFDFLVYGEDVGTIRLDGDGSLSVDPDGDGAAAGFRLPDQDFSLRSLLGNAVFRWEWRPGSTLFFIWQQSRRDSASGRGIAGARSRAGHFDFGRDTEAMFEVAPDNIFMVKLNYWLNP